MVSVQHMYHVSCTVHTRTYTHRGLYKAHFRVDVKDVCTLKCFALGLWIVQQETLFHDEESSRDEGSDSKLCTELHVHVHTCTCIDKHWRIDLPSTKTWELAGIATYMYMYIQVWPRAPSMRVAL